MKKQSTKSSRLSIEALEERAVAATFSHGFNDLFPPVAELPDLSATGSITRDQYGRVTATGTEFADIIQIDNIDFVATQYIFTTNAGGGAAALGDGFRVRVMDANGVLRNDAFGNPLDQEFLVKDISQVDVYAVGSDDQIINSSVMAMAAHGGDGNDSLTAGHANRQFLNGDGGNDSLFGGTNGDYLIGGSGEDELYGEGGSDHLAGDEGADFLYGGDGQDRLYGGADADFLFGAAGNDELYGGTGADYLYGEADADMLWGEEDVDLLLGGDGSDKLSGGLGADHLFGEAGQDTLRGNEDNDVLVGGDGNDNLYGGAGSDVLRGEHGNDGLFGGDGRDVLTGGPGIDRFLRWTKVGNSTAVKDRATNEPLITFKATTKQVEVEVDGRNPKYQARDWTANEIEAVDTAFAWLHEAVGNGKLLRRKFASGPNATSSFGDMTFYRVGNFIPDSMVKRVPPAWNRNNGTIFLTLPGGLVNGTELTQGDFSTVLHEIAHNWDDSGKWLGLSGWVSLAQPYAWGLAASPEMARSHDKLWIYRKTAQFAEDYGRTNPREDFATMFEAYYNWKEGLIRDPGEIARLIDKLNFIDSLIKRLA